MRGTIPRIAMYDENMYGRPNVLPVIANEAKLAVPAWRWLDHRQTRVRACGRGSNVTEEAVRLYLKDLTPSEPLFEKLHDQIRGVMHRYALENGYSFTLKELENVLWEYGLGHEQVDVKPVADTGTAEGRVDERFGKERQAGKGRVTAEETRIRKTVRDNLGEWNKVGGAKKLDEHTAFIIVHTHAQ